MTTGTKSLLFGIHNVFLHPMFLFIAWWDLYGFPWDPRLWVAFIVHDWGYFGKPKMDDDFGETHPEFGARIMGRLFGKKWQEFTLLHSRHYARTLGKDFSQLCVADKYASCIYPCSLYIFLARLSGEMAEYWDGSGDRHSEKWRESIKGLTSDEQWFEAFRDYMISWVEENKYRGRNVHSY